MTRTSLAPLLAGLVLVLPAIALSQPEPPAPPPPPAEGPQHHDWDSERGEGHGGMARHLKAMHDILGIRPDQEAAFQAMAAAMRPPMSPLHDHMTPPPHPDMAAMPAPDRLEHQLQMMDQGHAMMREHMQNVIAAMRELYAVLTPEQRRIVDNLPALGGGHEMGMHHGEDE
jgi:Spy/CpxP family protein refolding chaperone